MSFYESSDLDVSQTVEVIGFGRRLVAYLIDGAILWVVQIVLFVCFGFAIAVASESSNDPGFSLAVQCVSFLIALGYFVIFWATKAQTPGKMVMGIKVIGADGESVSWGKAVLRYVGYIISSLIFSLGFIWVAFDAKRQGWHDKIAGTLVVRKETQFSTIAPVTFVPSDPDRSGLVVVALALIPAFILIAIVVIAILLVLGPVVGNVFSNIVENLETPVPQ